MNIEYELMSKELARMMVEFIKIAEPNIEKKVERTAIDILIKIKEAICDEQLTDFDVVEKIVSLLENNNIDCGGRHDL